MQQTPSNQPKPIGIDLVKLQKDLEKKLNISAKDAANLVQNIKVQPMQDWRKTPRAGPTTNITVTAAPRTPGMR